MPNHARKLQASYLSSPRHERRNIRNVGVQKTGLWFCSNSVTSYTACSAMVSQSATDQQQTFDSYDRFVSLEVA